MEPVRRVPARLLRVTTALAAAALLAACPLLAACSLLPGPSSDFDISVENGTTLDIGIVVNGARVAAVAGGDGTVIPAAGLGPLPWRVVAVTSSGRELASMTVDASMGCVPNGGGGMSCHGAMGRADLVCGRFTMYAAGPFAGGPAPIPGAGDPCVP
jgi:hypothetical protein